MARYTVRWEIGLNADSAKEAAERAREWQRDPQATVGSFTVQRQGERGRITVDLDFPEASDPED